jgi:hypothetical protein
MKATSADNDSKLLAKLRSVNPYKVRVYTSDDDSRDVAVPARRRKWAQVIETINARAWSRCELLNKAGEVLGYIDNVEAPTEVEDLAVGPTTAKRAEAEWIVNLVVKAQEKAMHYRDTEVANLLRAQGDVVREMGQAAAAMAAVYRDIIGATNEAAAVRVQAAATAAGAGKDDIGQLLEALPQLLQMLPVIKQLIAGGSKSPNGVPHG